MGLTSGSFLALMVAVAVGWLAATVWIWPKLAGHGSGSRDPRYRDDGGYRDSPDSGAAHGDAGSRERGSPGAGYVTGGYRDAGHGGGGTLDAGYQDADRDGGYGSPGYIGGGSRDSGYRDAGYSDAGWGDAGYRDAGYSDGGYSDGGNGDGGNSDGGYGDSGFRYRDDSGVNRVAEGDRASQGDREVGDPGPGSRRSRPRALIRWRQGGRLAGRLAARVGLLAGGQVMVIAAFLVWLNGFFAFYGSWAQLLGTGAPAKAKPAAASARQPSLAGPGSLSGPPSGDGLVSAARRRQLLRSQVRFYGVGLGPGPGLSAVPPPTLPGGLKHFVRLPGAATYGEILRVAIKGQRTGLLTSGAYIYLPPQYFQPAFARHRFPVVLAFTGYPGGATSIIERLGLPSTAAALTAAGRARPTVYVMMLASPLFPRDTECTNIPGGAQVASFFAIDVPLALERTFRVTTARTGWATLGYSTGGYCAAKLAMLYPTRFSAAVSFAGYYTAVRDRTTGNLYGSTAYKHENDLLWRLQHLPAPPVSVLVTSSKVGEVTYHGTLRFLRLVHAPMHGYSYILPVGGHNFGVWGQELPQAIKWLSARMAASAAAPGSQSQGQQPGPQPAGAYVSG